MEFFTMFAAIFSTVYLLYKKWFKFLYPMPQQLFSYDKEKKQIIATGYCGYTLIKVPLNYFAIKGNYIIELNGHRVMSFVDNVLEGTEDGFTYYLGFNHFQAQGQILVKITDGLTEEHGKKLIKEGEIVDFGTLVGELLPDSL